jgi:hypothetical protein
MGGLRTGAGQCLALILWVFCRRRRWIDFLSNTSPIENTLCAKRARSRQYSAVVGDDPSYIRLNVLSVISCASRFLEKVDCRGDEERGTCIPSGSCGRTRSWRLRERIRSRQIDVLFKSSGLLQLVLLCSSKGELEF